MDSTSVSNLKDEEKLSLTEPDGEDSTTSSLQPLIPTTTQPMVWEDPDDEITDIVYDEELKLEIMDVLKEKTVREAYNQYNGTVDMGSLSAWKKRIKRVEKVEKTNPKKVEKKKRSVKKSGKKAEKRGKCFKEYDPKLKEAAMWLLKDRSVREVSEILHGSVNVKTLGGWKNKALKESNVSESSQPLLIQVLQYQGLIQMYY
eukprot:TRINITY_DN138455_c0_g1_i1.p1 TRINITY_DN138455_c0_g1~~TRINITY_DN138455_c0_g1_i1.p1  ORF type:complete len:202 (+),score=24.96 TRINITY_DN138455_c0_g1_i1:201-806(+)